MKIRFHGLIGAVLAICLQLAAGPIPAQDFPNRPVRMIIPYGPGGITDITARIIAPGMSEELGQQVIVENRAGGAAIPGFDLVAKSKPDGYTIVAATTALAAQPILFKKLPYQADKDFSPVSLVIVMPTILVIHPSIPARNVKELIALAKSQPGALTYGSAGNGSDNHLTAEVFKHAARIDALHVPYKGGGAVMIDLVAGHVEIFVAVISTAVPQVKAGKARALAVTGSRRAAALPDVPTVAEAALKGYEATNWYGYVAPAATPRAIVERLHKATVAVLEMPDVKQGLLDQGIEAAPSSPERFAAYIQSETGKWTKVIRAAGIKAGE